jgi:hypothetical protein
MSLTRRTLLKAPAIAAVGAMPLFASRLLLASAVPPSGSQAPGYYRFRLGHFELTAINDGVWNRPMGDHFVHNASRARCDARLRMHSFRCARCCRCRSPRSSSTPAASSS